MNENIKGKVIIIIGVSSGFGEVVVMYLLEFGVIVVFVVWCLEWIENLVKVIINKGGIVLVVIIDVMDKM